ncbi:MAG: hypothetical protein JSU73_11155 [candidate division WOR-3 bacterium]|nr:MAG: hypothetical protein JSU73_11155 [candidate division WOR-3 bacterium]
MKNIDRVVDNYDLKLRRGDLGRSRKCTVQDQVAHYRQSLEHQDRLTRLVTQELETLGVNPLNWIFYHAFARQVDRLMRKGVSGQSLGIEAMLLMSAWIGRGLSQLLLERICENVLGIGLSPDSA